MAEQQPKKRGRRLLNRPQQLTAAQKKRIIEVFDENKSLDAYKILGMEFDMPQKLVASFCAKIRAEGKLRNKRILKWSSFHHS